MATVGTRAGTGAAAAAAGIAAGAAAATAATGAVMAAAPLGPEPGTGAVAVAAAGAVGLITVGVPPLTRGSVAKRPALLLVSVLGVISPVLRPVTDVAAMEEAKK